MLPSIVEIHVHPTGVGRCKLANLQVNHYEESKPSVKEQQVYPTPFAPDTESLLPAHEAEVTPRIQEKCLKMSDQGFFQFALAILVLEIKEFKNKRILDLLLGKDICIRVGIHSPTQHGSLVP